MRPKQYRGQSVLQEHTRVFERLDQCRPHMFCAFDKCRTIRAQRGAMDTLAQTQTSPRNLCQTARDRGGSWFEPGGARPLLCRGGQVCVASWLCEFFISLHFAID
jgi:hypothetical protein